MRDVAQFFRVLGDEARLQILWLLCNRRELCVCDIMEALGITQSKASRHLATLRHAGLVVDRRDGTWSYYSLRAPESELERGQIEFLRAKLASHAGATSVLRDLKLWLQSKDREGTCDRGACAKQDGVTTARRRGDGDGKGRKARTPGKPRSEGRP
jgi:ArsR family transcriptional regulator